MRIMGEGGRGQLDDRGVAKLAFKGRGTQQHAEAGNRAGEFEVERGLAVVETLVDNASLDHGALVTFRVLVP